MVVFLFLYLPLCIAAGILAARYNRSGIGWFFFSLFLSPVLGFAFILACGPLPADPTDSRPSAPVRPTYAPTIHETSTPTESNLKPRIAGFVGIGAVAAIVGGLLALANSTPSTKPTQRVTTGSTWVSAAKVDADKVVKEAKRAEAPLTTGPSKPTIGPVTKFNHALGKNVTCANPKDHGTCKVAGDVRPPAPVPSGKRVVCDDPWQFMNCRWVAAR